MYPEGILPSGYCFLGSLFDWEYHLVYRRHPILFGQLECIMDNDRISTGTGIFLELFIYLDSAYEYS